MKPQHHLPLCILPWSVPVKQVPAPVWLLSLSQVELDTSSPASGTAPWRDLYQQAWVPHQPLEQKTCLGWTDQFWPFPSQWLPPRRYHCKQPCLTMPSQSAIHPLQLWHQKPPRPIVSLSPHNLRLILGQTWVPSLKKYSNCKGIWTGPWGDYLQPGHP